MLSCDVCLSVRLLVRPTRSCIVTKLLAEPWQPGISSNVDVREKAKHHTELSDKVVYSLYSSQHSLAYCTAVQ